MAAEPSSSDEGSMALGRPVDVEQVRAYLTRVVPVLLEEDVLPELSPLQTALEAAESQMRKFSEDPQERALLILRTLPPETGEEEGEGSVAEAADFRPSYEVRLGLNYKPARCVGMAFIKRGSILEADKSVRLQLRVINFSDDSPFETLHSYVRDAVTPYFNSYVQVAKKTA